MRANRIIWGFVSLMVLVTIALSSGSLPTLAQEQAQKPASTPPHVPADTRDLRKYGTTNFDNPDAVTTDTARFLKSKRYDNQKWVFKSVETNPHAAGVGKITDDPPPPRYPIEESSLIVVGEIASAKAFLSNDKSGVYTEFTIQVDETLKNDKKKNHGKVTADREGGVVVYPNGQRILYESSNLPLPLLGSKYLFFLVKREHGSDYEIRTSYYLSDSSVYPLEIPTAYKDFENTTRSHLIKVVRDKMAKSPL